jgi:hypothetical protein
MARQTIAKIHQQHCNRLKALGQGTNLQSPTYRVTVDIFSQPNLPGKARAKHHDENWSTANHSRGSHSHASVG